MDILLFSIKDFKMNEATKTSILLTAWCIALFFISIYSGPLTNREFVLLAVTFGLGALGFGLLQAYGFIWQMPLKKANDEVN